MCCDAAQVCLKSFRWKLINSVEWNYGNLKKNRERGKKWSIFTFTIPTGRSQI